MTVQRVGNARMSGAADSLLRSTDQAGRFTRRQVLAGTLAAAVGASLAHTPAAASEAGSLIVARLRPEHPRLWATMNDFVALKSRVASDPTLQRWHAQSRQAGERMLTQPVSEYVLNPTLLDMSRQVRNRTLILSMLFHLEDDDRFAERVWDELQAAAAFPDWFPSRFLSTAEMTHAFAIGYDWLYHYLSESRRETIRNAIVRLGLQAGLPEYRNPQQWSVANHNWNLVCNGGMGTGALAIGDEEPELAEEILQASLASVPIAIAEYGPDGGNPEGGNYWTYATRYLVAYLAALETAIGDDFGLSDSPGLSETGYFPIYITGPTGNSFNYNDSPDHTFRPPELFWLASRYDRPIYTWWGLPGAEEASAIRYLLWYDPDTDSDSDGPRAVGLPFDKHFRHTEVATFRGAWGAPRAVFAGLKAGDNQSNHGDLDLGTFVLDALGERWAVELGRDSYRLPGYFSNGPQGQRWTYYRKRAEGQNTLVVNPGAGPDQDPLATGRITRTESGHTQAFAVADVTPAYADRGVRSWHRGLALLDHRRQVLLQDEIQAREPVDSWWFMHTAAEVDISDDGRSATLRQNDKRLVARILAPETAAVFTVREAAPLDTSPDPEEQAANPGVRKLAIQVTGTTSMRLAVLFTPLRRWQELDPDLPDVEPLAEWNIPHPEVPQLSEIRVDGEPLEAFSSDVFTYDLVDLQAGGELIAPPVVDAAASGAGTRVIVHRAHAVPGTARIDVVQPRAPRARYEVHFDWRITAPFSDTWDFRNQDPNEVVVGNEGSRAVFGETDGPEEADPEWVESPTPDASGARPMVVSFDGSEDVVTLADTADIDLSPGFEFEAWVYQRARNRLPRIMHKGPGGFWINRDGSLSMVLRSTAGARARMDTVAGVLPLNAWTHVGLRYELTASDERRFRIYINGEETSYVRSESFSRGTRVNVVGHAMRLGNVDSHTRGLNGMIAFARLTVPVPDGPPQWSNELFT